MNFYDRTYVAYDGTETACDRKKFAFGFEHVFASGNHLMDGRHELKKDLRQTGTLALQTLCHMILET